jgi:hypothetical protein
MIVLPGLKLTKDFETIEILEVNYDAEYLSGECKWNGDWIGSRPGWAHLSTVRAWVKRGWLENDSSPW